MADMKSFWTGMVVAGVLGFFIFSSLGREIAGTTVRVGTAKARKKLKAWEKKA